MTGAICVEEQIAAQRRECEFALYFPTAEALACNRAAVELAEAAHLYLEGFTNAPEVVMPLIRANNAYRALRAQPATTPGSEPPQ